MSTGVSQELDAFKRFAEQRLAGRELSLEESVAAYRAYQAELKKFHEAVGLPCKELDDGGGAPLDIDAVIARGRAILAEKGIKD